jgi:hypothetical protein
VTHGSYVRVEVKPKYVGSDKICVGLRVRIVFGSVSYEYDRESVISWNSLSLVVNIRSSYILTSDYILNLFCMFLDGVMIDVGVEYGL